METFAPEFSKFWRPEARTGSADPASAVREDDGPQQAALQELAERVSAARSVI